MFTPLRLGLVGVGLLLAACDTFADPPACDGSFFGCDDDEFPVAPPIGFAGTAAVPIFPPPLVPPPPGIGLPAGSGAPFAGAPGIVDAGKPGVIDAGKIVPIDAGTKDNDAGDDAGSN